MPESADRPTKPRRTWLPMALWTAGILATLGLAWFVGAALQVRVAASRMASRCIQGPDDIRNLVEQKPGVGQIRIYLRLPELVAPNKPDALVLLAACGPEAVPILVEVLDGPDEEMSFRAVWALSVLGPDAQEAVPALVRILDRGEACHNENPGAALAYWAVEALGRIGPAARPAVPAIVRAARDDWEQIVAEALGRIGSHDKDAVDFLRECLDHDRYPVRARKAAAEALGKLGPAAAGAAPELAMMVRERECSDTLRAAVGALKAIAPKDADAWMALCEAVIDSNNEQPLRLSATQALVKIGRVPQMSLEHQREMLEDSVVKSTGPVRAAAAEALAKIRGEEPPK